jgi:Outer membrane lipoprotein-sorting protein
VINRSTVKRLLLSVTALMLFPHTASAIEVAEIVGKANHVAYYQGADGKARVKMVISDSQGRERTRELTMLRRNADNADGSDGQQKFYVYFSRPADVNKTAFLVWKNLGADDDRWLYLPALDLVKRVAASDERTSFVGSHFFYEDVSGRSPDEDTHELLEETDNYYVLKSTPKKAKDVEFAWYKNYIHKSTFLPVKTEFYDSNDTLYRTYEALKVEKIDGYQTVTASRMTDKRMGGHTELSYGDVSYNIGLKDDLFTERYLRNPPRRLLR